MSITFFLALLATMTWLMTLLDDLIIHKKINNQTLLFLLAMCTLWGIYHWQTH